MADRQLIVDAVVVLLREVGNSPQGEPDKSDTWQLLIPLIAAAYGPRRDEEVSAMLAALVLLMGLALLAGREILCLGQVVLAARVRFLPRWVWAVACLIFIPLGGILYLLVGRVWTPSATRSAA